LDTPKRITCLDEAKQHVTISVPEAGALFFGLSANGSYEAADRGDIPTIRVGRLRRVVVKAMLEKLGLEAA
jgi:hypothetical protein